MLNPTIPDTGPADYYYPTQETDKVLVIMGPSSAFLLALIGVSFIFIYAGPVTDPQCPINQEFNRCGSACPANCSHPDPPACIKICKKGCFCKKGYLDNELGGCIKEEICRACTGNKVYNSCGSACPKTCSNWNQTGRICTMQCVSNCFCRPGFVILSEGDDETRCVLPKDCPPVKKQ
ncbi:serine protease inhibitor swm-1-like [Rana temporaria]|uniref:serine protease inhibitor swm-1-like n=1 Tax=Rana temporaria TaxID=8407 RepID=UPI001AACE537|nr:serine protease inhibitor swm-1-like [Rana temporaria]